MPLILLYIQYSFNAQHVSAVNTTIFKVGFSLLNYKDDARSHKHKIHSSSLKEAAYTECGQSKPQKGRRTNRADKAE